MFSYINGISKTELAQKNSNLQSFITNILKNKYKVYNFNLFNDIRYLFFLKLGHLPLFWQGRLLDEQEDP